MTKAQQDELRRVLEPVRRRINRNRLARRAADGFAWGGAAAASIVLCGIGLAPQIAIMAGLAALALGPIVGVIAAVAQSTNLRSAAGAIDRHEELKDRTISAWQNVQHDPLSPVAAYQVREAMQHLQNLNPARIAPFDWRRVKRPLLRGVALSVAALLLMLLPRLVGLGLLSNAMPDTSPTPQRKRPEQKIPLSQQQIEQSLPGIGSHPENQQREQHDAVLPGARRVVREYFADPAAAPRQKQ